MPKKLVQKKNVFWTMIGFYCSYQGQSFVESGTFANEYPIELDTQWNTCFEPFFF